MPYAFILTLRQKTERKPGEKTTVTFHQKE